MPSMWEDAAAYDRYMQYSLDADAGGPHGHYCPLCGYGWDCLKEDCSEPHRIKCGNCDGEA